MSAGALQAQVRAVSAALQSCTGLAWVLARPVDEAIGEATLRCVDPDLGELTVSPGRFFWVEQGRGRAAPLGGAGDRTFLARVEEVARAMASACGAARGRAGDVGAVAEALAAATQAAGDPRLAEVRVEDVERRSFRGGAWLRLAYRRATGGPWQTLAQVRDVEGALHVEPDDPDGLGWRHRWEGGSWGQATEPGAARALVDALRGDLDAVTRRRLVVGERYRTLAPWRGLPAGAVLRYVGFDDVDNHYGVERFVTASGEAFDVPGDYATGDGPLAGVRAVLGRVG